MWWTIREQPIRLAIWYNVLSSVVTGLLAYGIGHTHTNISPWRLLFFMLGGFGVLWAIILYAFLPSSPIEAWWLSDREKFVALQRVRPNNTGVEDKTVKWYQAKECIMDPKSWLISIFGCAVNIPNGESIDPALYHVTGSIFANIYR